MKAFPSRLKAIRKEFGLKQHEIAADVSIDYLLGRTDKREVNR